MVDNIPSKKDKTCLILFSSCYAFKLPVTFCLPKQCKAWGLILQLIVDVTSNQIYIKRADIIIQDVPLNLLVPRCITTRIVASNWCNNLLCNASYENENPSGKKISRCVMILFVIISLIYPCPVKKWNELHVLIRVILWCRCVPTHRFHITDSIPR